MEIYEDDPEQVGRGWHRKTQKTTLKFCHQNDKSFIVAIRYKIQWMLLLEGVHFYAVDALRPPIRSIFCSKYEAGGQLLWSQLIFSPCVFLFLLNVFLIFNFINSVEDIKCVRDKLNSFFRDFRCKKNVKRLTNVIFIAFYSLFSQCFFAMERFFIS